MRTDRGRQRFYAAGWVISAGVMVVASRVWRLHLREVGQRAEEAERTREEGARKRGEEVSPALLAIQEASADAARELRTTLGVLRSDEDGDSSGLGHLDRLAARARVAGLPVTGTVSG